ncbi:SRPBCC domain-containing protein [Flavisolibacter sp. BT320]|nr:SRPBCC domain-containing protein [Flavisolibacter longurius]
MSFEIISATPDCEIISAKIVNAARDVAFAAWTDPDHLLNWWGPAGFTNTFHEFDLRKGGKWRFTMHGPGKRAYENECVFIQIEKPTLLAWKRITKPLFQVVATFEEVAPNRTKIIFRQVLDSAETCKKVKAFAGDRNEENFDRLEAELAKMAQKTR